MSKTQNLKYISYRIKYLGIGIILGLLFFGGYGFLLATQDMMPFALALSFIFFIVVIIVVSFIKIYIPYKESEKLMSRFLDGYELAADIPLLTPSTEKQIVKIESILRSPDIMEMNKRQAQYLALQNQINPHFLYNTLESIRSEALVAQLDSVADMTEALAVFFRYTISKVENLVSVEEELENCKTYFRIQKYRFGDRVDLHIEYGEDWQELRRLRMPKLTLQPILENSIIHGTELKLSTGNLRIQIECTQKRLLIRVSDDGVGMNEEVLLRLNEKLRSARTKEYQTQNAKGGIALVNVNNRIHLLFGEEYGMHVYSVEGVGTDVEISLPKIVSDTEVKNRGGWQ